MTARVNREYVCNRYPPAITRLGQTPLELKVAVIGSAELKLNLAFDCICFDVPPAADKDWVVKYAPDIVLVEAIFRDSDGFWSLGYPKDQSVGKFHDLCSVLREHDVPVVLWHRTDPDYAGHFVHLTEHMTLIACIDAESEEAYRNVGSRTLILPLAVQPALQNPVFEGQRPSGKKRTSSARYLHIGWSDFLEHPGLAEEFKLADLSDLAIVDDKWMFMTNKLDDVQKIRRCILGTVNYLQLIEAFKNHPYLWMPGSSLKSDAYRTRRALEAVSCGMSVVYEGRFRFEDRDPLCESIMFGNRIPEPRKVTARLQAGSQLNLPSEGSLKSRRALWSRHTYRHRLQTLSEAVEIDLPADELPLVSVIAPTKRTHLLDRIVEQFTKQTYPRKELLVVINRSDESALEMARELNEKTSENIAAFVLHESENIGTCLNFGISHMRGRYWFKMDDDDHYGENYVSDQLMLMHTLGVDAAAKPPVFTFFGGQQSVHARPHFVRELCINPERGIGCCGATLAGTLQLAQEIPFAEDKRSNVDSDFVQRVWESDREIIVGDRFNFVIHRAQDKTLHTWRMSDDELREQSIKLGGIEVFDQVNL